jgi:hypothetical protein
VAPIIAQQPDNGKEARIWRRADQFSNFRGTGILPVAKKHGQDARATANDITQLKQLISPGIWRQCCDGDHIGRNLRKTLAT